MNASARSLHISETNHVKGESLPIHEHAAPYLSFVLRGDYTEFLGRRSVHCPTYRVRFHPAGEIHSDQFGHAGAACLNIELNEQWNASLDELGLTDPNDLVLADDGAWIAFQIRERLPSCERSLLTLEEHTATLLNCCVRARHEARALREHAGVRRAVDYVMAHLAQQFSLGDVAAAASLHRTHLARAFRARMGCTLGDYTRRARVIRAQDLLRVHRDWPLSRVAAESGFADHAHLTRTFGRIIGTRPTAFRRLARG